MKIIVTHLSPDLDALASCWLVKKYLPGWSKADIKLVAAGSTFNHQPPDYNPDIIHVDTGYGQFDHHQTGDRLSATKLVADYLHQKGVIPTKDLLPLERLVDLITLIDNFGESSLPNPESDFYDLGLHQIVEGLKNTLQNEHAIIEFTNTLLETVLFNFKKKIQAEAEINKGYIFQSKWGKSLAVETRNPEVVHLAQKLDFILVAKKDPEKHWISIKVRPDCKINLDKIYKKLVLLNPNATWFYHASKRMLINGSATNPNAIPSHLPLKKIIEIIKEI